MSALWHDPGTWIALGVSVLFLLAGLVMHRVFVRILKSGSAEPSSHRSTPDAIDRHE
jgi:hypothetical protein